MLKTMGLIQRRGDLPLDAFRLHWRTIHRGLALRIAHAGLLRGYVQNHRLDIAVDVLVTVADGVPELWFDDVAAFASLRHSVAFRDGARHDEPNFMDVSDYRSLILSGEQVASPAMPGRRACAALLKSMLFLPAGAAKPQGRSLLMPDAIPVRLSWHRRAQADVKVRLADAALVETCWWTGLPAFLAAWAARPDRDICHAGMLVEERPIFWPGTAPPPSA